MQTPNSPSQSPTWYEGLTIATLFLAILVLSLLSSCSSSPHTPEDGLALDLQVAKVSPESSSELDRQVKSLYLWFYRPDGSLYEAKTYTGAQELSARLLHPDAGSYLLVAGVNIGHPYELTESRRAESLCIRLGQASPTNLPLYTGLRQIEVKAGQHNVAALQLCRLHP